MLSFGDVSALLQRHGTKRAVWREQSKVGPAAAVFRANDGAGVQVAKAVALPGEVPIDPSPPHDPFSERGHYRGPQKVKATQP